MMPFLNRTTFTLLLALLSGNVSAIGEEEIKLNEVPYGIEALAQYRSDYRYRGFSLADDTLEFQLSSLYALSNHSSIQAAAWYNSATGDGDFTESGLMAGLHHQIQKFQIGASLSYRDYQNSLFESGVNAELLAGWGFNDSITFTLRGSYDTGAKGWYSDLAGNYLIPLGSSSYLDLKLGLSAVSDYYSRNGLNDFFATLEYTYNINNSISLTPYIGNSTLLDNNDTGKDSFHGGVFFAVSF
ncbi:hypothetical protein [Rubritalea marina]|uniref:hypothetical protein n=1 Tax=Rubritalea marina TaxID=361055 RepID=UPI00036018DF|nr:hypothetical protein [Rubritalea marina]